MTTPTEMSAIENRVHNTQIQEEKKNAIKLYKAKKMTERINRPASNRMGKNEKKETARRAVVLEFPQEEGAAEEQEKQWRVSTKERIDLKRPKRKPGHR
jgi:hypothetical protein